MKKKKIYLPHSWGWLSIIFMMVGFLACDICVLEESFRGKLETTVVEYIVLFIALVFLLFEIFRLSISFKIVMFDTVIYAPSDLMTKNEKIQYKTTIPYADIEDIKIIASVKNSLNKRIAFRMSRLSDKKYLKFIDKDGKNKRICINHYTKKQVISILNEISQRMESFGGKKLNVDLIMQDWFSYGNIKKDRLE